MACLPLLEIAVQFTSQFYLLACLLSYLTWAITWLIIQEKIMQEKSSIYPCFCFFFFPLQVCLLTWNTLFKRYCNVLFPFCWGLKFTVFLWIWTLCNLWNLEILLLHLHITFFQNWHKNQTAQEVLCKPNKHKMYLSALQSNNDKKNEVFY